MLGDAVEVTDGYRHVVELHPALHRHRPATCTPTPTGSCSRSRCTPATRQEGAAFVPAYLDLLRAGGSLPPEELGRIVGVDLADPGFWDGGLTIIDGSSRPPRTRPARPAACSSPPTCSSAPEAELHRLGRVRLGRFARAVKRASGDRPRGRPAMATTTRAADRARPDRPGALPARVPARHARPPARRAGVVAPAARPASPSCARPASTWWPATTSSSRSAGTRSGSRRPQGSALRDVAEDPAGRVRSPTPTRRCRAASAGW